jgi:hypothetical protein
LPCCWQPTVLRLRPADAGKAARFEFGQPQTFAVAWTFPEVQPCRDRMPFDRPVVALGSGH